MSNVIKLVFKERYGNFIGGKFVESIHFLVLDQGCRI